MAKIELVTLANLENKTTATNTININSARIEEAMEQTLSRDGTGPNEMNASLDMNNNPIYNLPKATSDTEPLRKKEFDELEIAGDVTALLEAVASAQQSAEDAEDAAQVAVDAAASINLPPVVANTMLVANAAGTLRENKTFAEVVALLNIDPGAAFLYNAVTEGLCDNTGATVCATEVQASIAAAAAAGKICWFPNGTYDLGGNSIAISADNVRVLCQSRATVFLKSVDSATNRTTMDVTGDDFNWEGGRVRYTPLTYQLNGDHTAFLIKAPGSKVKNVQIDGRFYVSYFVFDTVDFVAEDISVWGAVNRCFYYGTTVHVSYIDGHFIRCRANGDELTNLGVQFSNYGFNNNGFGMGSGLGLTFTDCTTRFIKDHGFGSNERIQLVSYIGCKSLYTLNGPGFLSSFANGFQNQRVIFEGCQAFSCKQGFWIGQSSYVKIQNCSATICTADGFLILNSTACSINDNLSENNAGYGFLVDAASSGCSISDNIASANLTGAYSISGSGHSTVGNL